MFIVVFYRISLRLLNCCQKFDPEVSEIVKEADRERDYKSQLRISGQTDRPKLELVPKVMMTRRKK